MCVSSICTRFCSALWTELERESMLGFGFGFGFGFGGGGRGSCAMFIGIEKEGSRSSF